MGFCAFANLFGRLLRKLVGIKKVGQLSVTLLPRKLLGVPLGFHQDHSACLSAFFNFLMVDVSPLSSFNVTFRRFISRISSRWADVTIAATALPLLIMVGILRCETSVEISSRKHVVRPSMISKCERFPFFVDFIKFAF